jgi:hypothetical protein
MIRRLMCGSRPPPHPEVLGMIRDDRPHGNHGIRREVRTLPNQGVFGSRRLGIPGGARRLGKAAAGSNLLHAGCARAAPFAAIASAG